LTQVQNLESIFYT